jgi:RHS repeat-associated protein
MYDSQGNFSYRQDNLTGHLEILEYDALNRLTNWNIYLNENLQQQNSLTYDAITGNITTKSDIGDYTMSYGANGKPHALTSISGIPDNFPTNNLNVTYTDFKKIKTLTEDDKFYELTHGVDDQRSKSVYKLNDIPQSTHYYTGNYEELTDNLGNTRKIHYLSGGAILIHENNTETMYYGYSDNLGSLIALANESGTVVERYAYDPWGNRRNPNDWTQADTRASFILDRGYTGHEHLDAFSIINMNGRVYDPLTASFFSPDPYIQAPGNWLNYNRYSYCLNNPLVYTDPSGEFFFLIPHIGWSKSGGLSIGVTAILGIPGIASVQAGVGYSFKSNDFSATVGATAAFNTVYASYSTQSGFSAGWAAGLSPQMGFPVSTNFTSVGVNYNITHDSWSGNLSAWSVDKNGWTFNPSVSVMVYPEHTTNFVRGQGFRSNNQVLSRFVVNGQQQKALDYFGFKGDYDAGLGAGGQYDSQYDCISYGKSAFDSYDHLLSVYKEETFHQKDFLIYKSKAPSNIEDLHAYEEWRAQMYLYKGQGLYSNSGVNWKQRINMYGNIAGVYNTLLNPDLFQSKWWHFIYKIPRRW